MSDVALRLILISVVLLSVTGVTFVLRKRDSAPSRRLGVVDLDPGIYLFTSATCNDCEPVRRALIERLGSGGYTEIAWEERAEEFRSLGIGVVPVTVVVDDSGNGVMWPGAPDRMFSVVDP